MTDSRENRFTALAVRSRAQDVLRRAVVVVLAASLAAACGTAPAETGPRVVRPGVPGEPTRELGEAETTPAPLPHTEADVRFMRDMIVHHEQALAMSRLIEGRSRRPEILRLGERIVVSQEDEIALMRDWLARRGEAVPETSAGHGQHGHGSEHPLMPGMLTPEQFAYLEASSGLRFDRLFLAAMIQHHEGALDMVAELFETPGAAQEEEIFQFASHVEADQRIEIARMHRMLRVLMEIDS